MNLTNFLPQNFLKTVLFIILVSLLSGCGVRLNSGVYSGNGNKVIQLQENQKAAIDNTLREILKPEVQFVASTPVKAIVFANQPGLHVCGYILFRKARHSSKSERPFYIEFNEVNSTDIKRGQIGLNESKLAKVKFVCRHHFHH